MSGKTRIVVVDDHPLFREGVIHSLNAQPDFQVVGQGGSADEAYQLARELLPDLVLLDIHLPGDGVQAAQRIAAACPTTKTVMLIVSEDEDNVLAALKAGAKAYVLKGVSSRELAGVLRAVAGGEVWVAPKLAASLLVELARPSAPRPTAGPLDELTERERGVLELVAVGCSNREIGQRLYLSEKTVKHYMTSILQKLQLRSRTEAAVFAVRVGLTGGEAAKATFEAVPEE